MVGGWEEDKRGRGRTEEKKGGGKRKTGENERK